MVSSSNNRFGMSFPTTQATKDMQGGLKRTAADQNPARNTEYKPTNSATSSASQGATTTPVSQRPKKEATGAKGTVTDWGMSLAGGKDRDKYSKLDQ